MQNKILIKNVLLQNSTEHSSACDILISNGIIADITKPHQISTADTVIDGKHCVALPSFIDMQVHLRAPGQEEKEDLKTGTLAAAKGGYTHVACMPNTRPTLDNEKYIKWINQEVENRFTSAHIYPIAAMTENIAGKKIANYQTFKNLGVLAITDDGFGVQDDQVMEEVFQQAKKHQLILMQHCEYEHLSNKASFHEGVFTRKNNLHGYPSAAEYKMIERDLKLVEKYHVPYHVLHLSTKEGLELIKEAKKKNLPVTCEVTPHHLLLCDEDIIQPYSQYKMNPPLRGAHDREALQAGLADGYIDIVSTDHAPHTVEEKNKTFELAPFGIIGLEFAWPLLYTELYLKKKISFERLVDAFSYRARKIFNLPVTKVAKGETANLTFIHPHLLKEASKSELYSKSSNSPFLGKNLMGWPVLTLWNGIITFQDQKIFGDSHVN